MRKEKRQILINYFHIKEHENAGWSAEAFTPKNLSIATLKVSPFSFLTKASWCEFRTAFGLIWISAFCFEHCSLCSRAVLQQFVVFTKCNDNLTQRQRSVSMQSFLFKQRCSLVRKKLKDVTATLKKYVAKEFVTFWGTYSQGKVTVFFYTWVRLFSPSVLV